MYCSHVPVRKVVGATRRVAFDDLRG